MRNTLTILLMLSATGALIAWFDFIRRNIPDTLDDLAGKFANRDRPETAWGDWPAIPEEMRLPGMKAGGGPVRAGEPVTDTRQSHNQFPVSHSGRGVK